MYVQRNIEACSCNHCCSGKGVRITYSKCVFVALGIQHVMRMHPTVICGLPGCAVFSVSSQNCEKQLLTSSYLSARMELGSHWTDFHEI